MSSVNQKKGFKQNIFFQLQKQLRASVEKIIGNNKIGGKIQIILKFTIQRSLPLAVKDKQIQTPVKLEKIGSNQ